MAQAVRQRRLVLGLPQGAGGVSPATWGKIENAKETRYKRRTLVAVCKALGWTPDSIDRLLRGDDPLLADTEKEMLRLVATVSPPSLPADPADLDQLVGELYGTTIELREDVRILKLRLGHLERAVDILIEDRDEPTKLRDIVRAVNREEGFPAPQANAQAAHEPPSSPARGAQAEPPTS